MIQTERNIKNKEWRSSRKMVYDLLKKGELFGVFEYRKPQFMFGIRNYGEIRPAITNPADGDPWDICALGYSHKFEIGKSYKISEIVGEMKMWNGNHKLIVKIEGMDKYFSKGDFVCELMNYKSQYEVFMNCQRYPRHQYPINIEIMLY